MRSPQSSTGSQYEILEEQAVDHRSYAEMGISKCPDQPLGPGANALEGKGIASATGLRNEEKHAEARREEIELEYRQRVAKLSEWSKTIHRRHGSALVYRSAVQGTRRGGCSAA